MAKPVVPFKLESGVALPPAKRQRSSRYPWATIQPGQSFFIPGKTPKGLYQAAKGHKIKIAVRAWTEGKTIGTRVWRIKEAKGKGTK